MLNLKPMRNLTIILSMALAVSTAQARGLKKIKQPIPAPAFTTESILVADFDGNVVTEKEGNIVRPIASISKLMVALLASEQDQEERLEIPKVRTVQTSIPRNVPKLTREELMTLALVRSDNFAAQILCNNIDRCVERMNERAAEIGMTNTHYNEPTGLDRGNVSTATDLLKLLLVTTMNPIVTRISSMAKAEIPLDKTSIKIHNTNPLTAKLDVILSKTGFTNPAGGCLVMAVNSPVGQRILILLGSRNAKTRIPDMERIYKGL